MILVKVKGMQEACWEAALVPCELAAGACGVLGRRKSLAGRGNSRHTNRAGIARHFVKGQKFCAAGVWEGWGRLRPQEEALEACHVTMLGGGAGGTEGLNTGSGSFSLRTELQEGFCQ